MSSLVTNKHVSGVIFSRKCFGTILERRYGDNEENEDQDGEGSGINNIHMNDDEEMQINKYLLSAFSPTLRHLL